MKTASLFFFLFLTGSIQLVAGTPTSILTTYGFACNIPDGLIASNLTETSALLSWNAVSGATQYTVEVEDEQNNPSVFHIETNVTSTSFQVTGLQAGVSYKFKVRTRCGGDKSDWSEWMFFIAGNGSIGGSDTSSCAVVTGLAVSSIGGTAILSWNAVSGADKYLIEVEDEQNTPSNFHLEASSLTNTYTITGLQTGVLYKFKVRTDCSGGQSDWSAWMFFNGSGTGSGTGTGACLAPVMLSASVNGTSAQLSWNKVSGAAQYYLEIEDEQNVPSNFHLEMFVQDSFYTVTGLQAGVLYKFKVRTHCNGGQSDWSNWLFFNGSTGGVTGGSTGNCAKPTGALATDLSAHSALLTWNAVPGINSYTIEIERYQPGTAVWQITQVVTANAFLLTGLSPNTRYKFKVRSNCAGGGHSDWTAWRKFQTVAEVGNTPANANRDDAAANRDASQSASRFEVAVSPNPIQTTTTVRLQNLNTESATLRLFDLLGRQVQEQPIQSAGGAWEGTLAFGDLPNGWYLLQVQAGQNTRVIKLVVNH